MNVSGFGFINGEGFAICPPGGSVTIPGDTKIPSFSRIFSDVDELCNWLREQANAPEAASNNLSSNNGLVGFRPKGWLERGSRVKR